jgi:UDP-N-acetylmuramoyl-tripeptide--D-alanyl-D-alanine ligase
LQVYKLGALTLLDDSYNSNPASAAAALEALRHFPQPHCAVLGDMLELGPESRAFTRSWAGARSRSSG